ncbi:predicted protein [Streptomyces viridochromogenes DSM 40736]|uniref:Predicted protein n=1 Tax=Streptomyces viridochromogenes (strain DSM 40736 / JCM 4977 / BCRC 1201 / Tue 494) TaxID=591159 RepID=D9WYV7_STRVT|nr:predicted protein [Streptomyces viridochromogenes DSM 40736]
MSKGPHRKRWGPFDIVPGEALAGAPGFMGGRLPERLGVLITSVVDACTPSPVAVIPSEPNRSPYAAQPTTVSHDGECAHRLRTRVPRCTPTGLGLTVGLLRVAVRYLGEMEGFVTKMRIPVDSRVL